MIDFKGDIPLTNYITIPDFPQLFLVKQKLAEKKMADMEKHFLNELRKSEICDNTIRGSQVGIAVGSRGIKNLKILVKLLADYIHSRGGTPVIIPSMGSHGGADADGQTAILYDYGITESYTGAKIESNMEVIDLGPAEGGLRAYFDKTAAGCSLIFVLNRIKEHTDFYADTESGIMKMLSVGMGNHTGASYIHSFGVLGLVEYIPKIAAKIIESKSIIGVGIVEDGFGDIAEIEVMPGKEIYQKEKEMLKHARLLKPKIPFNKVDYIIIEEVGKNISGSGVDTKVIGRIYMSGVKDPEGPSPDIIAGLRLTPESHGNAAGVGLLDLITRRLYETIDLNATLENGRTSKCPERYKIPMFMENDKDTIRMGLEISRASGRFQNKILVIKNTGALGSMFVSKSLVEEARKLDRIEFISEEPVKLLFTEEDEYISLFRNDKKSSIIKMEGF